MTSPPSGAPVVHVACLKLTIIEARNLVFSDFTNKCEPYAVVNVGQETHFTTHRVKFTKNLASWNTTTTIDLADSDQVAEVHLYGHSAWKTNLFLGACRFELGRENIDEERVMTLVPREGKKSDLKLLRNAGRQDFGQLFVKIDYHFSKLNNLVKGATIAAIAATKKEKNVKRNEHENQNVSSDEAPPSIANIKDIKENIVRIVDYIEIMIQPIELLIHLALWRQPAHSLLTILLFNLIMRFKLLLPTIPILFVVVLVRNYFVWMRRGTGIDFWLISPKNVIDFEGTGAGVAKFKKVTESMEKVERVTTKICEKLDDVCGIFTWRKPSLAIKLVAVLSLAGLYLLILPLPPLNPILFVGGNVLFTVFPLKYYFPSLFKPSVTIPWLKHNCSYISRMFSNLRKRGFTPRASKLKPPNTSISPSNKSWRKGRRSSQLQVPEKREAAQLWYTLGITMTCGKTDTLTTNCIDPLFGQLSEDKATNTDALMEFLQFWIKCIDTAERVYVIPERILRLKDRHSNLEHLRLDEPIPIETYSMDPERLCRPEAAPLFEGCRTFYLPKSKNSIPFNAGLIINAVFQDTPPYIYYHQNRVSIFFRVYGCITQGLDDFQPAMCSSSAPHSVRALVVSCCQPQAPLRPTWNRIASFLVSLRKELKEDTQSSLALALQPPTLALQSQTLALQSQTLALQSQSSSNFRSTSASTATELVGYSDLNHSPSNLRVMIPGSKSPASNEPINQATLERLERFELEANLLRTDTHSTGSSGSVVSTPFQNGQVANEKIDPNKNRSVSIKSASGSPVRSTRSATSATNGGSPSTTSRTNTQASAASPSHGKVGKVLYRLFS